MASRKGKPNKMQASVKEDIVAVFTRLGGTAAMAEWAMENPGDFYTKIYAKMVPRNVDMAVKHVFIDDLTERLAHAKELSHASRLNS